MSSSVKPTRGMRDFLPTDKARREKVLGILRDTYLARGFQQIETPVMEPISRLKSGQGGENESMIFEVLRRGLDPQQPVSPSQSVDLGLRYDLTLPLSRFYASHLAELSSVFRSFQTGPVWRAERPQKGRFRQFNQVDIDILGAASCTAEIEILSTGWVAAERLGLAEQATILLNDRRLLNDLMAAAGIAADHFGAVLITLDKLHKIGAEKVKQEIVEGGLAQPASAQRLLELVEQLSQLDLGAQRADDTSPAGGSATSVPTSADETASEAAQGLAETKNDPEIALNLYDLPQIVTHLRKLHPAIQIRFDPTLVRGMGYYTGPIFELVHEEAGSSICGGGRYDGVIGRWSSRPVPAVGLSFGFERIIDLVQLTGDDAEINLALAYQKDAEALAALQLRDQLLQLDRAALAADGEAALQVGRVGLYKAPRKLNARFYDELAAQGYNRVLLPSAFMELAGAISSVPASSQSDPASPAQLPAENTTRLGQLLLQAKQL